MKKRLLQLLLIIILLLLGVFFFYINPRLDVLNNYLAKKACSSYFISHRSIESIANEDFGSLSLSISGFEVEEEQMRATASFFGIKKRTAVYDPNLGCRIILGVDDHKVSFDKPIPSYFNASSDSIAPEDKLWPYGTKELDTPISNIDYDLIDKAFDMAFDKEGQWEKKTRSLLVVHKDSLVREQYSGDNTMDTRFLGWSKTKSICGTLYGVLERQGKIDIKENNLFDQWKEDERKDITLDNLLRMSSGLLWNEDYGGNSQATEMLFSEENAAAYAIDTPSEHPHGTFWEYSSGTTNILSQLLRDKLGSQESYLAFPYTDLFYKMDIHSAQLEVDESGHYVLSSFMYATARDWAKLGLLYLHDGVWDQDTILNKSWVEYAETPAPHSDGQYGAQIWINGNQQEYPSCPEDTYKFSGYEGQYVFWIPSKDLVVVRHGLSKGPVFNMDAVLSTLIKAIKS